MVGRRLSDAITDAVGVAYGMPSCEYLYNMYVFVFIYIYIYIYVCVCISQLPVRIRPSIWVNPNLELAVRRKAAEESGARPLVDVLSDPREDLLSFSLERIKERTLFQHTLSWSCGARQQKSGARPLFDVLSDPREDLL